MTASIKQESQKAFAPGQIVTIPAPDTINRHFARYKATDGDDIIVETLGEKPGEARVPAADVREFRQWNPCP